MNQSNTQSALIPNSKTDSLEQRLKRFAAKLKRDFAAEIAKDQGAFKCKIIGKLRVYLPRKRPRRKGSPEVRLALEIYQRDFESKGKPANWHIICLQVFKDYSGLSPDLQNLRRFQLRAAVHSLTHEEKGRNQRRRIGTLFCDR